MRRLLLTLRVLAVAIILLLAVASPVNAQIKIPDGVFQIQQVEVYRNNLEINDQLYIITARITYPGGIPIYDISQAYLVTLRTAAGAILGTTTFYPYFNSGYALAMASIYFSATTAPAWNQPYVIHIQGNPTLHWLDLTATHTMGGAEAANTGGTVFVDETAASNSVAANDMTLLPPAPGGAVVNDAYYWGGTRMFNIVTLNIGTAGNWAGTLAWEYYNGTAWVAVSGLVDGTVRFTAAAGNHDVTYTCPTDWQMVAVNGVTQYWLRARVATITAFVAQPLGTQSWTNMRDNPPAIQTNTFSLWYDGGTLTATKDRLTTRLRAVASTLGTDWGGGAWVLIQNKGGVLKLTTAGEAYFDSSIDNLRTICPDIYSSVITTPSYPQFKLVRDNWMGGDDTHHDTTAANTWYAETYTTSSAYSINGIWIKAYRVGAPGILTASIRATVGTLPTAGPDLVVGTANANDFTTDTIGGWYQVSFTSSVLLTTGLQYAIVVRTPGGAADYIAWMSQTAGDYAGGQAVSSGNGGINWAVIGGGGEDFMFGVTAVEAYSMSYRDRLAQQLVGTRFDFTDLGANLKMSRMWASTMFYLIACFIIAYAAVKGANDFRIATPVILVLLPFGALAGFIYLEAALVMTFLSGVATTYIYVYRGAP